MAIWVGHGSAVLSRVSWDSREKRKKKGWDGGGRCGQGFLRRRQSSARVSKLKTCVFVKLTPSIVSEPRVTTQLFLTSEPDRSESVNRVNHPPPPHSWFGQAQIGLVWSGLALVALSYFGFDFGLDWWLALNLVGLDHWIGLTWVGLGWFGLGCTILSWPGLGMGCIVNRTQLYTH